VPDSHDIIRSFPQAREKIIPCFHHLILPAEFPSLTACAVSQSQWFLCTTMGETQWAFSLISPYLSLFSWISVGPASTSSSFFLGS
jgi:hypothetical protein